MQTVFMYLLGLTSVVLLILLILVFYKLKEYAKNNVKLSNSIHRLVMQKELLNSLLEKLSYSFPTQPLEIIENDFPFKATDIENYSNVPLQSIRFKKKDGQVLVYINGTINPTKNKIHIQDLQSLKVNDMLKLKCKILDCIEKNNKYTSYGIDNLLNCLNNIKTN